MNAIMRRCISLLLALVMLIGISPGILAVDESAVPETVAPSVSPVVSEMPEPTEQPTETPLPSETPTPTEPPQEAPEPMNSVALMQALAPKDPEFNPDKDIMVAANTVTNLMFFNLSNPDYTIRISTPIYAKYQVNGNGPVKSSTLRYFGWHYCSGDPNHTLFCIEPCKNFGESTSYNASDKGVGLDGAPETHGMEMWYSLPRERREAIGMILLQGDALWDHSINAKTTPKNSNPNVILRLAMQLLIFEVVTGCRDANTFDRLSSNGYMSGSAFYEGGCRASSDFAWRYDSIVSRVKNAMLVPSFTSKDSANAPTIKLTGYSTKLWDSNGVLPEFAFADGFGVAFSKSGSELTIRKTGGISSSTLFRCSREMRSPESTTYSLWYSPYLDKYQTCISLYNPSVSNVTGYFHLKDSSGDVDIVKTTEDGNNIANWQFGIYSDADCAHLISGPHKTDSAGRINVTSLPEGTVYVKELGHTIPEINAKYTCDGPNPQSVEIVGGSTAKVSFYNKLSTGNLELYKTVTDGSSPEGWQFKITDANGIEIAGSPFNMGADGMIPVDNLMAGTYTIEELIPADSLYYCKEENPKTVEIRAGNRSTVQFTNALKAGKLVVEKINGRQEHLAGAKFLLEWSEDGTVWSPVFYSDLPDPVMGGCSNTGILDGCLTTSESGFIQWDNLHPGLYYRVTELEAPEGYGLLKDYAYEGKLPAEDFVVTLKVVNGEIFMLPQTGTVSLQMSQLSALVFEVCGMCVLLCVKRKYI